VCERLAREGGFGGVEIDENVCKVSVVGVGMRTHCGVASVAFKTLADAQINIHTISTSEIVIGCIIDAKDGQRAARLLHQSFWLDQEQPAPTG
jgi:aspartate kinase